MKGFALILFGVVALTQADRRNGALKICAAEGSDGVLVAHQNCNQFYKCDHGAPVALNCPSGLLYNPATEQCDWADDVQCGDRPNIEIEGENNGGDQDCNEEQDKETESVSGGNSNPSKAPEICAKDGSDGVLVAHENCNQFYKCSEGVPVALNCPSNLLYNPANEQCDWPHNVNCDDRHTDSGDSNNEDSTEKETNTGGNSDPSKAPEICAKDGSDGVLVAHENCNKFYKCSEGVPVALNCPSNLLYNPANEQCDWPHNVNCANRHTDSGDSNNKDSTEKETNTGGNSDPSKAPEICAKDGSDGVLVAHENCNQFYKCSEGLPVALDCPSNLLYNPANEQCDWPENVNCADRNTDSGDSNNEDSTEKETNTGGNSDPSKAPEICAKDGSDGVLVAHENCNQFYKCSEGLPVALDCPLNLLYNPANEQCDWPENVNCADRNTDSGDSNNEDSTEKETNTGGNSDPSKAPEICAEDGSDGVLVAHENCNQFYKCSEGLPVALDCPLNLLYNPANEQCDWPENVNCKGRYDALLSLNKHRQAK